MDGKEIIQDIANLNLFKYISSVKNQLTRFEIWTLKTLVISKDQLNKY